MWYTFGSSCWENMWRLLGKIDPKPIRGVMSCRQIQKLRVKADGSDLGISQDAEKSVLGTCPLTFELYTINETNKQYSLSDTLLDNAPCFAPTKNICT